MLHVHFAESDILVQILVVIEPGVNTVLSRMFVGCLPCIWYRVNLVIARTCGEGQKYWARNQRKWTE